MAVGRTRYERRSFATALLSYLQSAGWNITSVEEQFIKDVPLTIPAVGVHFIPSKLKELQMGRDAKFFVRSVQVDVYMESEARAEAIIDDIGDFMDEISINVVDKDSNLLAYMISDSESITLENPPLNAASPALVRWRGIARATYEVNYID